MQVEEEGYSFIDFVEVRWREKFRGANCLSNCLLLSAGFSAFAYFRLGQTLSGFCASKFPVSFEKQNEHSGPG